MITRWLSLGLLFAGGALLGVAAYDYWAPADGPGVTLTGPDLDLAALTAGQALEVGVRLYNPTNRTARVVGVGIC